MRAHRLAGLALLLSCVYAAAQTQDTDAVLTAVRARIAHSDFRASGRLVRVDGSSRVTARFNLKGHWFPDGLRLLYDFNIAGAKPERLLLHMDEHGRVTASGTEPEGFGIVPEDLVEGQFFWASQNAGSTETVGQRTCTDLKSVPAASAESRYASVTSCVDTGIGWPLKSEKTLRAGGGKQVVTYGGLRQSSGVWIATEIRMQASGAQAGTLLLIDHGSAKARLAMKDFDLKQPVDAARDAAPEK